ncbi:MAG TPA: NifB/NifX family molybdenum-iron cluster-binding protein [bacterium]
MKVAFATTDGLLVDEHFGRAGRFALYDFRADGYERLPDMVFTEGRDAAVEATRGAGLEHDRAVEAKVERLGDCRLVYLTQVGGPSAARLTRRGVMPVKVPERTVIPEAAERLMEQIRTSPPPWLRRALADEEARTDNPTGEGAAR